MNSEAPIRKTRGDEKDSLGSAPWFATFSLLDAGGAISSSQMQRLVASITTLWRRTIGRLVWWT
jgi:hypothetical protein